MKYYCTILLVVGLLIRCNVPPPEAVVTIPVSGPIQLHPDNPHYFLFKGEPMALITSAEHYGAVLNLDFDYQRYLEALAEDGMNYTRIFTGVYYEINGESFGIQNNTLAPAEGRVITPWEKVKHPSGGERFNLSSWNQSYFERLKNFMAAADSLGIIVEVTLFSSIYRDAHWDISPQNPINNINIEHELTRFDAQTMNNGDLFDFQSGMVRKLVHELNEFDNVFFEIQNEPWSDHAVAVYNIMNKEDLKVGDWTFKADFADDAAMEWQEKLAEVIVEEERKLPKKHLIAQNYTNFKAPIPEVSDHISIINFHYAWPEAVEWNYHYDKVLGFDESGFAGSEDQVYRRQAWKFMLNGGGLFNSLDYSFFAGHEDGMGLNDAPGGGSKTLRQQLNILSDFLHGFELEKLYPNKGCVVSAPGLIPYVLSDDNKAYAVYLRAIGIKSTSLKLRTGDGSYRVLTLDPITGAYTDRGMAETIEGILTIELEIPVGEIALKLEAVD